MPIANYTTKVPAMRSVGEIQGILVAHGAKSIMINFNGAEPESLAFLVSTSHGDLPFLLPANIDRLQKVLDGQRVRTQVDRAMAARVAWRILKDWVRAQMAMLETEMVELEQIFLPYMEVEQGKNLYQTMNDRGFYLGVGKGD